MQTDTLAGALPSNPAVPQSGPKGGGPATGAPLLLVVGPEDKGGGGCGQPPLTPFARRPLRGQLARLRLAPRPGNGAPVSRTDPGPGATGGLRPQCAPFGSQPAPCGRNPPAVPADRLAALDRPRGGPGAAAAGARPAGSQAPARRRDRGAGVRAGGAGRAKRASLRGPVGPSVCGGQGPERSANAASGLRGAQLRAVCPSGARRSARPGAERAASRRRACCRRSRRDAARPPPDARGHAGRAASCEQREPFAATGRAHFR